MFRAIGVSGNKRQIDGGGGHARQLNLRFFRGFFQPLHGHFVTGQVNTGFRLKSLHQPVDNSLVKIVAAQAVIAVSGQHFLHAVAHLNDRHIEGAAAQVVYHNLLILFFIHAISQRRRSRLIDNPFYIQARNLARVLCSLTLRIGEVGRYGDDRFGNFLAQIALRIFFEL